MSDPLKIVLAGKEYEVDAPLTIGEIIRLKVAVSLAETGDSDEDTRRAHMRLVRVLAVALGPKYPEMTEEHILTLRSSNVEYMTAANSILELSGLVTRVPASGEATPATQ